MRLKSKGDLVRASLRKIGVASNATLTDTEPQSIEDSLDDLEMMMAEWENGDSDKGIALGYAFSDDGVPPGPDDVHSLPTYSLNAVISNLAVRIANDYGFDPPQTLVLKARRGKELLIKALSRKRTPVLSYPNRMPVGSGNRLFNGQRYFHRKDKNHD
ncbi:TPA: packaged DNA stabilization gp4 family protein [Serratia marcescens]